jgi:hypothetical protein
VKNIQDISITFVITHWRRNSKNLHEGQFHCYEVKFLEIAVPYFKSYQHLMDQSWYTKLRINKGISLFHFRDAIYLSYLSIYLSICLSVCGSTALCWSLAAFQFLNMYTVGRTLWTGDQPIARPLPIQGTTQTQNKRTQTSMPWVGFELMTPMFERTKTVHALDGAATLISRHQHLHTLNT